MVERRKKVSWTTIFPSHHCIRQIYTFLSDTTTCEYLCEKCYYAGKKGEKASESADAESMDVEPNVTTSEE